MAVAIKNTVGSVDLPAYTQLEAMKEMWEYIKANAVAGPAGANGTPGSFIYIGTGVPTNG